MHALNTNVSRVTAYAPATSGNVIVGFDILGFALSGVGDTVTVERNQRGSLLIDSIKSEDDLSTDPMANTATVAMAAMCADLGIAPGFSVSIKKGIRLGSGMGGSAASAVAATVALNQFLEQPLSSQALLTYALQGEGLSCAHGRAPADNVVPCLYGGLTLSCGQSPYDVVQLPVPDLNCILVHPHLMINTKDSRGVLDSHVPMDLHVNQSANLAYFLVALYEKDYPLMQRRWKDVVVEPQRSNLITGFSAVQQAALDHGALGASLSGSGPSMFAWAESHVDSQALACAMSEAFLQSQVSSDCWVAPICEQPAHVMEVN